MSGFRPDSPVFFMLVRSRESGYLGVYLHGLDTRVHVDRIAQPEPPSVRIRFDSRLDLPLPLFPSKLRRGRGKGPVAGSRCQSIIVLVVGIFDSYYLCRCRGRVCVKAKWKTRKHLTARELQPRKQEEFVIIMLDWESRFVSLNKCDEDNTKGYCKLCKNSFTVAYDGLKAVTHHAEAKKHKECESAAAVSHRLKPFFTPKGSAQSEKVGIAELTEAYHSIKHQYLCVAQDCP
ncbi:hypothetical protein TNCV_1752501 [Trichonephila clavipes]|nr:hypothetical protein TNCV_1752501 [Trichonephila clavipes]